MTAETLFTRVENISDSLLIGTEHEPDTKIIADRLINTELSNPEKFVENLRKFEPGKTSRENSFRKIIRINLLTRIVFLTLLQ